MGIQSTWDSDCILPGKNAPAQGVHNQTLSAGEAMLLYSVLQGALLAIPSSDSKESSIFWDVDIWGHIPHLLRSALSCSYPQHRAGNFSPTLLNPATWKDLRAVQSWGLVWWHGGTKEL